MERCKNVFDLFKKQKRNKTKKPPPKQNYYTKPLPTYLHGV